MKTGFIGFFGFHIYTNITTVTVGLVWPARLWPDYCRAWLLELSIGFSTKITRYAHWQHDLIMFGNAT